MPLILKYYRGEESRRLSRGHRQGHVAGCWLGFPAAAACMLHAESNRSTDLLLSLGTKRVWAWRRGHQDVIYRILAWLSERALHACRKFRAPVTSTANFGRHSLRDSDAQRLLHFKKHTTFKNFPSQRGLNL